MFEKQITELTYIATRCLSLATDLIKQKNDTNYLCQEKTIIQIEKQKINKKGGKTRVQKGWYTYRSKEKRWMGRYKLSDGTLVYAYSKKGGTKKECSVKLKDAIDAAAQKQKLRKPITISKNMTLNQWYNWWWENLGKYKYKKSTAKNHQYQYNSVIKTTIGDLKLNQINEAMLTSFFSKLKNITQKQYAKKILNTLLELAKAKNYIEVNPMRFAVIEYNNKELKNTKKKKNILLQKDEKKLFKRMENSKIHDICKFILYTGLRKGEALALTWEDVDFEINTIRINKNMDYCNNIVTQTKTESSERTIPLFPQAKAIIDKRKSFVKDKTEIIFKEVNGGALTNSFKRYCKYFDLDIAIHNLRHTFATRCLEAGIMPKVVQSWLGHKNYAVTIDTYTHVTDTMEYTEVKKMAAYLQTN